MDLFEAKVQAEVAKRLKTELDQLVNNPEMVISAYRAKLESTQYKLLETTKELETVSSDYTRLVDAEGNYDMKDAAKLLKYKRSDGKQVGRTDLFMFLRDINVLNKDNTPAQTAVDNGWLDEITGTFIIKGIEQVYVKTVVTPKGLERIRRFMESSFDEWWVG